MTASRPDPVQSLRLAGLVLVAACLVLVDTGNGTRAQDSGEQSAEDTSDTRADQQSPAPVGADEKRAERPIRPFFGDRPDLPRQKGPVAGTPYSIRLEPFVARTSLTLPPAREEQNDGQSGTPAETPSPGNSPGQAATDAETAQSAPASQALQGQNPFASQAFEASDLGRLDASVEAVDGVEGSASLWAGYTHSRAAERLRAISDLDLSPSARDLARSLALGGFVFSEDPARTTLEGDEGAQSASQSDRLALVEARLALLERVGDAKGYQALLDDLPADTDLSQLDEQSARAALFRGDLLAACDLARSARTRAASRFWIRIAVMCAASAGDRSAVDFQLGILEETSAVEPALYALSDMMLTEAEVGTAGDRTLASPLPLDTLFVAMARLARADVSLVDAERATPLGIKAALALPGLTGQAYEVVAERALAELIVDPAPFAATLRSSTLAPDRLSTLFVDAETDLSFRVDLDLLTLLATQDALAADRRSAMVALWRRAGFNTRLNLAPVLLELASDLPATGEPSDAVRARAALAADQPLQAQRFFGALRTVGLTDRVEAAQSLIDLAPLMAIAGLDGAPALDRDLLTLWTNQDQPQRPHPARHGLALVLAEATGHTVPPGAWDDLAVRQRSFAVDGAAELIRQEAAPIVPWRQLVAARLSNDRPALYSAALALLGPGDPLSLSPAMVGSVIGTLRESGEADAARRLALSLLIRAGV